MASCPWSCKQLQWDTLKQKKKSCKEKGKVLVGKKKYKWKLWKQIWFKCGICMCENVIIKFIIIYHILRIYANKYNKQFILKMKSMKCNYMFCRSTNHRFYWTSTVYSAILSTKGLWSRYLYMISHVLITTYKSLGKCEGLRSLPTSWYIVARSYLV